MDHCTSWASWCKWVEQKSTYLLSDPNWITLGRLLHHPQSSLIYERGMIMIPGRYQWIWGVRETMTANTYLCPNMVEYLVNGVGSNVLSWTLASVLIEASSISTEKGVRVFLLFLCRRTDAYPKVNGHRSFILCSKSLPCTQFLWTEMNPTYSPGRGELQHSIITWHLSWDSPECLSDQGFHDV